MFQINIITNSQKNLETIEKNNIFYDNIDGEVKLYRIPSENISLTDKFETFRFLPISRTNLIFIIAIPENCTNENIINYFGKEVEKIKGILFIKSQNKFTSLIIHFNNQDSADNFYYQFKTKNYSENKSEFLYCVFISKILYNDDEKNNNLNITEMPTCPLCIEKVEPSSIGIETMLNIFPCNRWLNYKKNCKVCSKFPYINLLKCEKCENLNSNSLWCCLICGFIGCNRYEEKHLILHYKETNHRYSIELSTQRIWDYMTDKFVHRIINTEHSQILLEDNNNIEEAPSTQEFLQRMENVIEEYNKVLATQLELQRKYYEDEVKKMEEKYNNNNNSKLNSVLDDIKKKKYKIKLNQKLYKDCVKKLGEQDKQIEKIKDDIELNKNFIKNIMEDNEKVKRGEVKNKIIEEKEIAIKKQKEKIDFLQKELEKYYSEL